ncbi:MAG: hypothetical protein ACR2K6_07670 [Solirubrobacterales bacterium]
MAARAETGVVFPQLDGGRSTTKTGRAIFADAARAADGGLADRISDERKWREEYLTHVRDLTEASAADSTAAIGIARAGIASVRERLSFERDGEVVAVGEASSVGPDPAKLRDAVTIEGDAEPRDELVVPYGDEELSGDRLRAQLADWVERGIVEPSFKAAIETVTDHPEWLALPGRRLLLIGAGSEMGPYEPLLEWGASLMAIDVPKPKIWKRLLESAESSAGNVTFPVREGDGPLAERAGIDLREDLPEAIAWVRANRADDGLVVGTYAYMDGALHAQVSAAADVLGTEIAADDPLAAIAYLATPTDAYLVGPEVVEEANRRWQERKLRTLAQTPLRLLSGGRLFQQSYERVLPDGRGVADALVGIQGQNYALAKRMQRWRGVIARADGRAVSFNVAPSSWTSSVTSNRILAAAYAGARHFGIEVFEPRTTRVLMAALLAHDLNCESPPPGPDAHPEELFSQGAAHGGLWRAAYEPRSALGVAAVAGLPGSLLR